jgi:hypothetical protein
MDRGRLHALRYLSNFLFSVFLSIFRTRMIRRANLSCDIWPHVIPCVAKFFPLLFFT